MHISEQEYGVKGVSYSIRSAEIEDAEALSHLRLQLDGETEHFDREPGEALLDAQGFAQLIQADSIGANRLMLVAVMEQRIVGYCRCHGSELKRLAHQVEFGVGVLKACWGFGIGTNLMKASMAWADASGIKKMSLKVVETNENAILLYKKLGFEVEGRLKYDRIHADGNYYSTVLMGRYRSEVAQGHAPVAGACWTREDGFTIHMDKRFLDLEAIYQFLTQESYWAKEIKKEMVQAAVEHSTLIFGIYDGDPSKGAAQQVGFARVVSDLVRFAWLGDVFVLPQYRGRGLSKWLMSIIVNHPKLKGTSFNLGTRDAHSLYAQYGFKPLAQVENRMARPMSWPAIYEGYGLTE